MLDFKVVVHIGVHKSGTTWLQKSFFTNHPDLDFVNDYNEPWKDNLIKYLIKNDNQFSPKRAQEILVNSIKSNKSQSASKTIIISSEDLAGHPYSGAYNREEIAKRISQAFPEAKILITIRNQYDAIYSIYNTMVRLGYLGKINDMLNEEFWIRPGFNKSFFDYYKIYQLYLDFYKKENILLLSKEELSDNPVEYTNKLCDFLLVGSNRFSLNTSIVGKKIADKKILAFSIMNHFRKTDYNPYPLINIRNELIFKTLVKAISFFIFFNSLKKDFKDNERKYIYEYYFDSNEKLIFNNLIEPKYHLNK